MRNRALKSVLTITLALSLGGCAAIFGKGRPVNQVTREAPLMASAHTDAGRGHLDAGRTGLAIEAFQRALVMGEAPASALNGLGVAFARLGRFDQAQRFFNEAIAHDQANEQYAANLVRLMQSPLLAMRRDGDIGRQVLAAAEAALPAKSTADQTGPIRRVSRGEVHIVTTAQDADVRSSLALARSTPPSTPGGLQRVSRSEVRINTTKNVAARPARLSGSRSIVGFQPLVRVTLTDAKPAQAIAVRAPALRKSGTVAIAGPQPTVGKELPKSRTVSFGNVGIPATESQGRTAPR